MIDYPPGAPCWFDLGSPSPDRAATFYSALLGWTIDTPDPDGYRFCRLDGQFAAALGPGGELGKPYWTTYFSVTDVRATLAAIITNRGIETVAPYGVEGVGTFANANDSTGAPMCLWQPIELSGVQARDVPGAWALSHLHAHDPATESAFYTSVFGWEPKQSNTPSTLGTLTLNGIPLATTSKVEGLSNEPSKWLVVFGTANLPKAVAVAVGLGGALVTEFDSAASRVVVLTDDQGALFGLCQSVGFLNPKTFS
jgi:uncharacterized protein